MTKSRVLLLAPSFHNLYKDLIKELDNQGYDVDWIEDVIYSSSRNRFLKKIFGSRLNNYILKDRCLFNNRLWTKVFQDQNKNFRYDYLLAVDGHSTCNVLIDKLIEINPKIKKILYLYDTFDDNNQLDSILKYYKNIYTYDIDNASEYGLKTLPIWWCPSELKLENYDIFGFASLGINSSRYELYKGVKQRSKELDLNVLIKLFVPYVNRNFMIKYLKKILKGYRALQEDSEIITNQAINPNDFKGLINSSNIILDAIGHDQAGMTARFSWAIGAGKRIITDNRAVMKYPFYDPDQIYIVNGDYQIPQSFFSKSFCMKKEIRNEVNKFRIDNFVKTIMT